MKNTIITLSTVVALAGASNAQTWLVSNSNTQGTLKTDVITLVNQLQQSAGRAAVGQSVDTSFSPSSAFGGKDGLAVTTTDVIGIFNFSESSVGDFYEFSFGSGLSEDTYFHFTAGDTVARSLNAPDLKFSTGTLVSYDPDDTRESKRRRRFSVTRCRHY